ncbi:Lrp/AsnC family transcriptional regulator [Mucilaginibacter lacusdianchii]|uniref:Lrp/AsnC family transcriptional regulator n=1 Tax=Mucilaginibacter lacusdianchii TaxID=2684211 RepID=UPI001E612361|nr:Lrp/AsnC family transcriptional regulator [Mucilaginibacter sp. JXJ CY 39]
MNELIFQELDIFFQKAIRFCFLLFDQNLDFFSTLPTTMPLTELDPTKAKILKLLQTDALLTNKEISIKLNKSIAPFLKESGD